MWSSVLDRRTNKNGKEIDKRSENFELTIYAKSKSISEFPFRKNVKHVMSIELYKSCMLGALRKCLKMLEFAMIYFFINIRSGSTYTAQHSFTWLHVQIDSL